MRIFLSIAILLSTLSFASNNSIGGSYLDNVPGEEYLGLTEGCHLSLFASTLTKHPNHINGIVIGKVVSQEECVEAPRTKSSTTDGTQIYFISRPEGTTSWKFNYDVKLKLSHGENQYEIDNLQRKSLNLSSCGDINQTLWQKDTLWVAGSSAFCKVELGSTNVLKVVEASLNVHSLTLVDDKIYSLDSDAKVSLCAGEACSLINTFTSPISQKSQFQAWKSANQVSIIALGADGYLQIQNGSTGASSLNEYLEFKNPVVWLDEGDVRISFIDKSQLVTVDELGNQLERSVLFSGTFWNKLGVQSFLSPIWTTGLTGIVQLNAGQLEEHGSYHHLGSSGLTAFTLSPQASYYDKQFLNVLWSTVGARNATMQIIQHTADSSWVYYTVAQTAGIQYHQIKMDTLKGVDGEYQFSVVIEQVEEGNNQRDSMSLSFVLDRKAPSGTPIWSLDKEAADTLLVGSSLVLSPSQKLKVNLDNVQDQIPFTSGLVKLNLSLQEQGGSYKYNYIISKDSINNFELAGLSAAGFPMKQGIYSISWYFSDSLGNRGDTLTSLSFGSNTYSTFGIGARAPIIKGTITPFLIDVLSLNKARMLVEVVGEVDNNYEFALELDVNSTRQPLSPEIAIIPSVPSSITLGANGKYNQRFDLDLSSATIKGTNSIVIKLKDAFGKWIEYPVPFAKDEVNTQIITPVQNESLSERSDLRGIVAAPKLASEDFLGYRSYYTQGIINLDTGLTLTEIMGRANWEPLALPLSNQSIIYDGRSFYPTVDLPYPNSNLGRSDFTQNSLLGFFNPAAPSDTGDYTIILISEYLSSEKFAIDYDWKNVNWQGDGKESKNYFFTVTQDTNALNLTDSTSIEFIINSNIDGHVYMNLVKSSTVGDLTNIVLVKQFSVFKDSPISWVFDGKSETFERYLSNGSYKALFHFVPSEAIHADTLAQKSFLLMGNTISDSSSSLTVIPNRVEWVSGDSLNRGVDIHVNLEVPTNFAVEIGQILGDSIIKVRDLGDFLTADKELYWDLKDSSGNLIVPTDSLKFLLSLKEVSGKLISSKIVTLALLSGELISIDSPLEGALDSGLGFWMPEVVDQFRFLAKASGPISYYPLKNVEITNIQIVGKQMQRNFYDIPWQLSIKKYYKSLDVVANYYYNYKGANGVVDYTDWDKGMKNAKFDRYSFYNDSTRFPGIQIAETKIEYEHCLASSAPNNCYFGDVDTLPINRELWSGAIHDYEKAIYSPSGILSNTVIKLLKLDKKLLNKDGTTYSCKGPDGESYSNRYNHFATGFCKDEYGAQTSKSYAHPLLSDFNLQNYQWDSHHKKGMYNFSNAEAKFAVSDIVRQANKDYDNVWRKRSKEAYLNVYLLNRQKCNSAIMSQRLPDRMHTGDTALTNSIYSNKGVLGALIYSNSLENSGNFPSDGPYKIERTIEVDEEIVNYTFWNNEDFLLDNHGRYQLGGFVSGVLQLRPNYDEDQLYRADYLNRPKVDWGDSYLSQERATDPINLNQVTLWQNKDYLQKIVDPVDWNTTKSNDDCDTINIHGGTNTWGKKVGEEWKAGYHGKQKVRICENTPGGNKMGISGYSILPLLEVPYRGDTALPHEEFKTFDNIISNFYSRSKDSGQVFWKNSPHKLDTINPNTKEEYIHYSCLDRTDLDYGSEVLGFNPQLIVDRSTFGYVWDTIQVTLPFTDINPEGIKLGVYPENPNLIVAFRAKAGLTWMIRDSSNLLQNQMGRSIDPLLNKGYVDSQRVVLDSSRFVEFWQNLQGVGSVPDSLYDYILRDSLVFTADLQLNEAGKTTYANQGDTLDGKIVGKAFLNQATDEIFIDLFYLDIPSSFLWSSEADSSFDATAGKLPGRGVLYPNGMRGSDSALGSDGFLGVVQTGKIKVPHFSSSNTRQLYSSLAPFVIIDDKLQYNPSLSLESLVWDVEAFYDDGETSLSGLNIIASDTGNILVNLEPNQGFHQFLPLSLKDSIRSNYVANGSNYSFDHYTISYLDYEKPESQRRIIPIPVNSFFRNSSSKYIGGKPDVNLDLWADSSSQSNIGFWDVTSLVGKKLLVVDVHYRLSAASTDTKILRSTHPIILGEVATSDTADVIVLSPGKRAELLMPAGILAPGEAVSIHTLSPEELPLNADYPDVIPVGPILSLESSGDTDFSSKMPQITFHYSARDIYKLRKTEEEYTIATSETIIAYLKSIQSDYRLHVLSKDGTKFDHIVTTQTVVESSDKEAVLLKLTGEVPHFSYVFVLQGNINNYIPVIKSIEGKGDSLKVRGLVSLDTNGMSKPYDLEIIISKKATLRDISNTDIVFQDSLQFEDIHFTFTMSSASWNEGLYYFYVRQKDASSSAKDSYLLVDSLQRVWNINENPNPVIPNCKGASHDLIFEAKWDQSMTRLIKDSTGFVVFRDEVKILSGTNSLSFDGCNNASELEGGKYSYELVDSIKTWVHFEIGIGKAIDKIQSIYAIPDTLIQSSTLSTTGSKIYLSGKGLIALSDGHISLSIYDKNLALVYQSNDWNNLSDSTANHLWTGVNSQGVQVTSGIYSVIVEVNGVQLRSYILVKNAEKPLDLQLSLSPDTSYFPLTNGLLNFHSNQSFNIKVKAIGDSSETWLFGDSLNTQSISPGRSSLNLSWIDTTKQLPDSLSIWAQTKEGEVLQQRIEWNLFSNYPEITVVDVSPWDTLWPSYMVSKDVISNSFPTNWSMNLKVEQRGEAIVKVSQNGKAVYSDSLTLEVGNRSWTWNGVDSLGEFVEGPFSIQIIRVPSHPFSNSKILNVKNNLWLEKFPDVLIVADSSNHSMFNFAINLEDTLRSKYAVKSIRIIDEDEAYAFMSLHDKGVLVFLESNSAKFYSDGLAHSYYRFLSKGGAIAFFNDFPLEKVDGYSSTILKTISLFGSGVDLENWEIQTDSSKFLKFLTLDKSKIDMFNLEFEAPEVASWINETSTFSSWSISDSAMRANGVYYDPIVNLKDSKDFISGLVYSTNMKFRNQGSMLVYSPFDIPLTTSKLDQGFAYQIWKFFLGADHSVDSRKVVFNTPNLMTGEKLYRGDTIQMNVSVTQRADPGLESFPVYLKIAMPDNSYQIIDTISTMWGNSTVYSKFEIPVSLDCSFDSVTIYFELDTMKYFDKDSILQREMFLSNNFDSVKIEIADNQSPNLYWRDNKENSFDSLIQSASRDTVSWWFSPTGYDRRLDGNLRTRHGYGVLKVKMSWVEPSGKILKTSSFTQVQKDSVVNWDFDLPKFSLADSIPEMYFIIQAEDKYKNISLDTLVIKLDSRFPILDSLSLLNANWYWDKGIQPDSLYPDSTLGGWVLGNRYGNLFSQWHDEIGIDSLRLDLEGTILLNKSINSLSYRGTDKITAKSEAQGLDGEWLLSAIDSAGNRIGVSLNVRADIEAPAILVYEYTSTWIDTLLSSPSIQDSLLHYTDSGKKVIPLKARPLYLAAGEDFLHKPDNGWSIDPAYNTVIAASTIKRNFDSTRQVIVNGTRDSISLIVEYFDLTNPLALREYKWNGTYISTEYDPYYDRIPEVWKADYYSHYRNRILKFPLGLKDSLVVTLTDSTGNKRVINLVFEGEKSNATFVDPKGDTLSNGTDLGEFYLASKDIGSDSLELDLLVHSYSSHLNENSYWYLDLDSIVGASVALGDLASPVNITGVDYRVAILNLDSSDTDLNQFAELQKWALGKWIIIDTITTLNTNQLDNPFTSSVGEGHQVLPTNRIAFAPYQILELQLRMLKPTGLSHLNNRRWAFDAKVDIAVDSILGTLPFGSKIGDFKADAFVSDWYNESIPELAMVQKLNVEISNVTIENDSVFSFGLDLKNVGFKIINGARFEINLPNTLCPDKLKFGDVDLAISLGSKFVLESEKLLSSKDLQGSSSSGYGIRLRMQNSVFTSGSHWRGTPKISVSVPQCTIENSMLNNINLNILEVH
jgi:hypothetical protein